MAVLGVAEYTAWSLPCTRSLVRLFLLPLCLPWAGGAHHARRDRTMTRPHAYHAYTYHGQEAHITRGETSFAMLLDLGLVVLKQACNRMYRGW